MKKSFNTWWWLRNLRAFYANFLLFTIDFFSTCNNSNTHLQILPIIWKFHVGFLLHYLSTKELGKRHLLSIYIWYPWNFISKESIHWQSKSRRRGGHAETTPSGLINNIYLLEVRCWYFIFSHRSPAPHKPFKREKRRLDFLFYACIRSVC